MNEGQNETIVQEVAKYIDIDSGEIFVSAEEAYREKEKREKEQAGNKNPPFIQLTKGIGPETLSKVSERSSTSISILMFFLENMDDYNTIMVSQKVIADTLGKTRQTISSGIKILEEENVLGIGKVGQANVYIINPNIAWQKANKQRGMVNLKGNILLGKSENEELFKKFNSIADTKRLKRENLITKVVKEDKEKYKKD